MCFLSWVFPPATVPNVTSPNDATPMRSGLENVSITSNIIVPKKNNRNVSTFPSSAENAAENRNHFTKSTDVQKKRNVSCCRKRSANLKSIYVNADPVPANANETRYTAIKRAAFLAQENLSSTPVDFNVSKIPWSRGRNSVFRTACNLPPRKLGMFSPAFGILSFSSMFQMRTFYVLFLLLMLVLFLTQLALNKSGPVNIMAWNDSRNYPLKN